MSFFSEPADTCRSSHVKPESTPPREGPREVATCRGKWFPDCYEAIQYARARNWIGAKIYGLRSGALLATIEKAPDYQQHWITRIEAYTETGGREVREQQHENRDAAHSINIALGTGIAFAKGWGDPGAHNKMKAIQVGM